MRCVAPAFSAQILFRLVHQCRSSLWLRHLRFQQGLFSNHVHLYCMAPTHTFSNCPVCRVAPIPANSAQIRQFKHQTLTPERKSPLLLLLSCPPPPNSKMGGSERRLRQQRICLPLSDTRPVGATFSQKSTASKSPFVLHSWLLWISVIFFLFLHSLSTGSGWFIYFIFLNKTNLEAKRKRRNHKIDSSPPTF